MKILIIGIGNPGRGDDALGPVLVERLAGVEPGSLPENSVVRIPGGPSVVWKYQLNIEDALLIRDFDDVVFADASHEDGEPVTWVEIAPAAAIAFTTHALPPAAVLGLAEELYGRTPRARLLAMRGERWEAAANLSESAAANLSRALNVLARVIIPPPMTAKKQLYVLQDILGPNQKVAREIKTACEKRGVLVLNLMSSPGAGKTTLLESLAERFKGRLRIAVIEGDIETERDAERIRAKGVPAWQITTGGACHLEAKMIARVLPEVDPDIDILFIENVGNLVCPASYELGERLRVVLLSIPEGDDKPKKYPKAFATAHVLVLSKVDLLPYLPFDLERARAEALEINPKLRVFILSALTGEGMDAFVEFLTAAREELRSPDA